MQVIRRLLRHKIKMKRRPKGGDFLKKNFFKKAFEKADMPLEVMFDVPYVTIAGDFSFTVENYMGIISYGSDELKINTKTAIIKLTGEGLELSVITEDIISVSGKIKSFEFI